MCGYGYGRERLQQLQQASALVSPASVLSRQSRSLSLFGSVCLMLALLAALEALGGIAGRESSTNLTRIEQVCLADSLSAALQSMLFLAVALSLTCFVSIGANLRRILHSIRGAWRSYFE